MKIPVFDIGDTLVPSRRFAEHIIEDELRQRNHEVVHDFNPDKFMMYDPDQIQRYLEKYDIVGDAEKLARTCRDRYLEAFEDLMVEQDIFDLFAQCNKEFGTIGIISDNSLRAKELMKELLNEHGVDYDSIVVSDEVGAEKPDPEIFQAFIDKRDEDAEDFVYFGNDASRDTGAERVGMDFVWVTEFDTVNSSYDGFEIDELCFENIKGVIEELNS